MWLVTWRMESRQNPASKVIIVILTHVVVTWQATAKTKKTMRRTAAADEHAVAVTVVVVVVVAVVLRPTGSTSLRSAVTPPMHSSDPPCLPHPLLPTTPYPPALAHYRCLVDAAPTLALVLALSSLWLALIVLRLVKRKKWTAAACFDYDVSPQRPAAPTAAPRCWRSSV